LCFEQEVGGRNFAGPFPAVSQTNSPEQYKYDLGLCLAAYLGANDVRIRKLKKKYVFLQISSCFKEERKQKLFK
jgi:hypothetical protein